MMKKENCLISFIVALVALCAVAAIIVTNIDKIRMFLEAFKKNADDAFSRCHCFCNADIPEESDFEDVEI